MKKNRIFYKQIAAVLLLVISLISISYSWFGRDVESGSYLTFKKTVGIKSFSCNIETYIGEPDYTKSIVYDESVEMIFSGQPFDYFINNVYDDKIYFKTNITNTSTVNSKLSLYFGNISYAGSSDEFKKLHIGITNPTKNYRNIDDSLGEVNITNCNDYNLVKNIKVEPGETVEVKWFLDVGNINLSNLYITTLYANSN